MESTKNDSEELLKRKLKERLEILIERKKDEDYTLSIPKQAAEMTINYNTFLKYKDGVASCPAHNLVKIAKYYNVSVDYLLGLTDTSAADTNVRAICEYIGISHKAVSELRKYRLSGFRRALDLVAYMLEEGVFIKLGNLAGECVTIARSVYKYKTDIMPSLHLSDEEMELLSGGDYEGREDLEEKYEYCCDTLEDCQRMLHGLDREYNGTMWASYNVIMHVFQKYVDVVVAKYQEKGGGKDNGKH